MDCIIRSVKQGDEACLAYIQTESWKSAFGDILAEDVLTKAADVNRSQAMYEQLIADKVGNGYILEADGRPHCIAWWDRARDADMSDCAELICIHSLQSGWRKGYGTKMMDRVISDIKKAGYDRVVLWVFADNYRARGFYEACGFAANGRSKPCLGTSEVCYERAL